MALHHLCPLDIPEIAHIVCSFVAPKDMLPLALTCRTMYYAMITRVWHTLEPRSHMVLRKLKNTLDGRHISFNKSLDPQYHSLVRVFKWTILKDDVTTHMFERPFFDRFLFARLERLEFSYAASQDSAVAPMIRAARLSLRYLDLSHCYCLSTETILPLINLPQPQLDTVILYGCGKIDSSVLVELVHQHHRTLKCLGFTDITDELLGAIEQCHELQDLGLEHCSEDGVSLGGLDRFSPPKTLTRLRMRDIANLTNRHLERITTNLTHLDLSECPRVRQLVIAPPPRLQVLCLAYQSGVSNSAIQRFATTCQLLSLDVSGCRLTDDAFDPAHLLSLIELNLSGIELSSQLLYRLLTMLPALNELCLGVAYDLADAARLLDNVNTGKPIYRMNVEKCHTISRIHSTVS